MSHARTLAAFALVVAAFVALATLLTSGVHAGAVQVPPAAVELPAEAPLDEDPFLVALLGTGTDLPTNAADLDAAADRVCEGLTAGVPVAVMADTVAAEFAVDGEQSREFVNLAGVIRCPVE